MRIHFHIIVAVLAVLAVAALPASAQQDWWSSHQSSLTEKNILQGVAFDPARAVTFQEFREILARAKTHADIFSTTRIPTLPTLISRAEAVAAIVNELHIEKKDIIMPFRDVRPTIWYASQVATAYAQGIISGIPGQSRFEPRQPLTMSALAKMLAIAISLHDTTVASNQIAPPSAASVPHELPRLHVAITPGSSSASIPRNAFNATFVGFTFFNQSNTDIELRSLTLTRQGLGAPEHFQNIRLMHGSRQLGTDKTFTRQGTVAFTFPRDPLIVRAGTSAMIEVKADLRDMGAGFSHQIGIMSPHDMEAVIMESGDAVNIMGQFPLFPGAVSTGAVASGVLTYQLIDPYGSTQATLGLRASNVLLTRLMLSADSEDIEINSITFRNAGSAHEGEIADLNLYQNNRRMAGPEQMNGRTVTFDFGLTPLLLKHGTVITLDLRGFLAGGFEKTVGFEIDHSADIQAVSLQSGHAVQIRKSSASQPITPDLIR